MLVRRLKPTLLLLLLIVGAIWTLLPDRPSATRTIRPVPDTFADPSGGSPVRAGDQAAPARVEPVDAPPATLAYVRSDDDGIIRGQVWAARDQRVTGARVAAYRGVDGQVAVAKTDAGGAFVLPPLDAEIDLVVSADGFVATTHKRVAPGQHVNVRLRRPVTLTVRVEDPHGPVVGATVSVRDPTGLAQQGFESSAVTDCDGCCRVGDLPEGRLAGVCVLGAAHLPWSRYVTIGQETGSLVARIVPATCVDGEVLDGTLRSPIAGAAVCVHGGGPPVTTDAGGRFSIPAAGGAQASVTFLEVCAEGYATHRQRLGAERFVTLSMSALGDVAGRVHDADGPVAGAEVSLHRLDSGVTAEWSTTADDDGFFHVRASLRYGAYVLVARKGALSAEHIFDVRESVVEALDVGDLEMTGERRLCCVVEREGKRQPGVSVRIGVMRERHLRVLREGFTDCRGMVEFPGVACGELRVAVGGSMAWHLLTLDARSKGRIVVELESREWRDDGFVGRVAAAQGPLVIVEDTSRRGEVGTLVLVTRDGVRTAWAKVVSRGGDRIVCQLDTRAVVEGPGPGDAVFLCQ